MIEYFTFYNKNNTPYEFQVFPIETEFFEVAGVYILTKKEVSQQQQSKRKY